MNTRPRATLRSPERGIPFLAAPAYPCVLRCAYIDGRVEEFSFDVEVRIEERWLVASSSDGRRVYVTTRDLLWWTTEPATVTLPFKGRRFWRLIVTTCRQPAGAPFLDDGYTRDQEGREYVSKSLLLTPWRRNVHGEHDAQRALTVGWLR